MKKLNLGIIGCSEIAYRRFLPALKKSEHFNYVGVASRNLENTQKFIDVYNGKGYKGYDDIINDPTIDVLYIPLPPALHYKWAKKALQKGKHVLLEKPFATTLEECEELLCIAEQNNLVVFENYMFQFHKQLEVIQAILKEELIGAVRGYRIAFGFPQREKDDFRYNKELGGGALLDCGGYTIKLATILLGESSQIKTARLNYIDEFEVDIYGTATMENEEGLTAQVSFGMDNAYKCELEVWGSKGKIKAPRIFTAPPELSPVIMYETHTDEKEIEIEHTDQFLGSINRFYEAVVDDGIRREISREIQNQAKHINRIINYNGELKNGDGL